MFRVVCSYKKLDCKKIQFQSVSKQGGDIPSAYGGSRTIGRDIGSRVGVINDHELSLAILVEIFPNIWALSLSTFTSLLTKFCYRSRYFFITFLLLFVIFSFFSRFSIIMSTLSMKCDDK